MNLRISVRIGRAKFAYTVRNIRTVDVHLTRDGERRLYFCDHLNRIIVTPLEHEIQDVQLIYLPELTNDLQPQHAAGSRADQRHGAIEAAFPRR